jgi:hypothetical protein
MPARNPVERRLQSQKGNLGRWRPGTDTTEIDRQIKAVRAEDYIRELVDDAPPLTAAQRDRLAVILRSGRAPDEQPLDAA